MTENTCNVNWHARNSETIECQPPDLRSAFDNDRPCRN